MKEKSSGIYSKEELIEIIKDTSVPLSDKNMIIAFTSVMIMSFITIIFLLLTNALPIFFTLHILFFVLIILGLFNINKWIFHEVNGRITKHSSTVALVFLCSYIFIKTNGLQSAGPIWFLFCYLFISLVFDKKTTLFFHIFTLISFFVSLYISLNYDYGYEIKEASNRFIIIYSFIIVSITSAIIMQVEKKIGQHERQRILALSEELTTLNEELIAIQEELKISNAKLSDSLEQTQSNLEMHQRFSTVLTHELRSPLNGIIGTLYMIFDHPIDDETRDNVEQCLSTSNYMLHIVNDLLDFAKLQAGKFEILPTDFDLHNVINEIKKNYTNMATTKGLNLILQIDDCTVCGLHGDEYRIIQIVNNLVSNAIKYTNKGNVLVKINVTDSHLCMIVKDEGQGMSEESLKDLFTPYKRFNEEKNQKIQGTGIGLSIVNELIKAMNGTIDVESKLNEGSTFTVNIPVQLIDRANVYQSHSPIANRKNEKPVVSLDLNSKKLIYIDDSVINLRIFKHMVEKYNGEIDIYESSLEGLDQIKAQKYDYIFVDHIIPNLSGEDLLFAIKNEENINQSTPMIILTGDTGKGVEEKYLNMGFAGYLSKPVSEIDLYQVIDRISLE